VKWISKNECFLQVGKQVYKPKRCRELDRVMNIRSFDNYHSAYGTYGEFTTVGVIKIINTLVGHFGLGEHSHVVELGGCRGKLFESQCLIFQTALHISQIKTVFSVLHRQNSLYVESVSRVSGIIS